MLNVEVKVRLLLVILRTLIFVSSVALVLTIGGYAHYLTMLLFSITVTQQNCSSAEIGLINKALIASRL